MPDLTSTENKMLALLYSTQSNSHCRDIIKTEIDYNMGILLDDVINIQDQIKIMIN